MRSLTVRKLLNKYCHHHEEWHCGPSTIHFTGRDESPRFDRRMQIFFSQSPGTVDVKKIEKLLCLLDRLARGKKYS